MMIMTDRDALLCDLAETYQIYDFSQFRPRKLAIFACGLRADSRIKMKLNGMTYVSHEAIMAKASDELTLIRHYLTAKKNDPDPELLTDVIYESEGTDTAAFSSGKAFSDAWDKLTKAVTNG